MEPKEIAEAIIEVQKRIDILDEVMSWTLPEQVADQDQELEELAVGQLPTGNGFHGANAEQAGIG
jgi:hypothetical protein